MFRRPVIGRIFQKIERKSSRNKVYDAIRDAIFSGKLLPGQRLTETQLAEDFNVSRVVIREALQQLAHDGLVVQNSYKGTNVVLLRSKEVNEILSVRVALETEAVRQAKPLLTEDDKYELKRLVKEVDSTQEPYLHTRLDSQLHEKIWELSGNQTLKRILIHLTAPLFAMSVIVRQSKQFDPRSEKATYGKHEELIEAIVNGNTEQAVAAMTLHIEMNRKNIGENFDLFIEEEFAKRTDANESISQFALIT